MTDEKLKPCPFCGADAELCENKTHDFFVRCTDTGCHARTRNHHENSVGAIDAWNERYYDRGHGKMVIETDEYGNVHYKIESNAYVVSQDDMERFASSVADLRQLVSDLWDFAIIGTNTPPVFTAQWHERAVMLRDRARDLGIEVRQ